MQLIANLLDNSLFGLRDFLTTEKMSAMISLFVAILILAANFFQWWDVTYNSNFKTKRWVRILLAIGILLLLVALILLLL